MTRKHFAFCAKSYNEVSIESEEEKDIIQYFRKMSKSGKRIFMGMLEEVKDK